MKNLNDIAEEYRDVVLDKLAKLREDRDILSDNVTPQEDFRDIDDQIGHWVATIQMIDKILAKVDDPIPEIVVEVTKGLITGVYSNTTGNKVHLYMVDWDNIGCEREYLHCLPLYGEPNHIDRENWDIKHLLNLYMERHMKNLDKWEPIDD